MGRRRNPTTEYQEKPLEKTIGKQCYRVVPDEAEGNGPFRLECNNRHKCRRSTLDEIAYEFYLITQTEKSVEIKPYEIIHKSIGQMDIKWIHIFDNDKEIIPYLFKFYNEEWLLEPEEGEEPWSMEQLYEGGDCQAAIHWMEFLWVRKRIEKEPSYEPCLHRMMFNIKGNECYIIFNMEENKPKVLENFCTYNNESIDSVNGRTKEELKEKLLGTAVVVVSKFKNKKKYQGSDVISEEDLEKYYFQPYVYKTDGMGKIEMIQTQVAKEYIIREFVKLLKANKHEVAAIAGIPQLTKLEVSADRIPQKG